MEQKSRAVGSVIAPSSPRSKRTPKFSQQVPFMSFNFLIVFIAQFQVWISGAGEDSDASSVASEVSQSSDSEDDKEQVSKAI